MENPQTDIICLVHNNLPVTKGFVKSLFENTKNFRLIFVDNGSTDQSVIIYLKEGEGEGRWNLIRSENNLGVIGGRNLGAKHVESEFFINIDNDQYPCSDWLGSLYLLINKGFDVVGPEAWQLLPPKCGGKVNIGNLSINRDYYPVKRCTRPNDYFSYIGCGGMLIRKSVYNDIGLFDEQFNPAYYEDPDFCWRCIQSGYKIGWQPQCLINHLSHQTINQQKLFSKNSQFIKSWQLFKKKWYPYFPELMRMANA